jgi:Predicted pyridoxal phosphate-dependent enzyme apparently involved in regulation of cell wall biogenesis
MMDHIPIIEPVVGEEEISNVKSVIDSLHLTQGPYTEQLEEMFASMVSVEHAIATTSCTTGMELTLEALGIGDGDEVIVPDFTYPATATAVERVGASPVLVDVDRQTYNIDPAAVAEAITNDTVALLPVAWGGQPLDHEPLQAIANKHGLTIVEDAACSAKANFDGQPVGSQFDVSVFSLHPRKVLTTGEGGVITTDDAELTREIRSIKNFGTDPMGDRHGFFKSNATNNRFSDILAAVGVAQLEKADKIIGRRREIAARYDELIDEVDGVTAPKVIDGGSHNYQCYCVYIESGDDSLRDSLIEALADEAIETLIGTYALSETEAFSDATRGSDLSTSKDLYHNLLTLPVAHSMTEADQQRVVTALQEAIETLTA